MAHSTIVFKHPTFGTIKNTPVGFSWTTALFGFFPALFRGDFKWAAIIFGVTCGVSLVTMGFGAFVCWIVFGLMYNKMYIRELVAKGYVVDRIESRFTLDQLQAQLETVLKPAQAV
ncbi:hypothetical protein PTE30175_02163 [Pandoraea terrae]|uniref:DUF2628 domain-containing protein n=1 Tax=Pandoraea terrae TaxID=1537710 RepID=A0A5E4UVN1_9BURK|nr:DUF2628 domain-containing protein [Pandoraea terrae]VVE02995.1 hypothetical protein PTE30175_02163 [Pandoraea terrae]